MVEVFTVQALAPSVRSVAVGGVRSLVAPGGELLAVEVVRPGDQDPADGPPWLLDRTEMTSFAGDEVTLSSLRAAANPLRPDGRPLWVGVLHRR